MKRFSTKQYWDERYFNGGNSGEGSYGRFASLKADFVNDVIQQLSCESILDLGCGDGNNSTLFSRVSYTGVDISDNAIAICRSRFGSDFRRFQSLEALKGSSDTFDLTLSLEVAMHILEEELFLEHLFLLFSRAKKAVIMMTPIIPHLEGLKQLKHEKSRHMLPYFSPFLGDFNLVKIVITHRQGYLQRAAGEIDLCSSDLLLFTKNYSVFKE